jgi:thiamine-phosphate pyrophosphorylase
LLDSHQSPDPRVPTPDSRLPKLYAIVDVDVARRATWTPRDLCRAYLAGGVRFVQLRAKSLASGPFVELAVALAEDVVGAGGLLIVNDRADLAVLAGASGVHVGQDDLPADEARRIVGDARMVGLSTHTIEQVRVALDAPISYIAVGPMFDTTTKDTGYGVVGLEFLRGAVAEVRAGGRDTPIVAIGGITLERAPAAIDAGAASVAVITDLLTHDPETRARQFTTALR